MSAGENLDVCQECGNDSPAEGYNYCLDCLTVVHVSYHDPFCYVRVDLLMQVIFADGCRVCDLIRQVRDDERQRIIKQISEHQSSDCTTQPLKETDTLQ